jgi:uncharacterized membrane protein
MSGKLQRLAIWAGGIFLCAPFWIGTAALIPSYIDASHSTNIVLNTQLFMSLLWFSGFSVGIPAAVAALCVRTKAGRMLAVSATVFGMALIAMGNAQRHIFGYNGVRGGVDKLLLYSILPITLWVISVIIAKKATSQEQDQGERT